MNFRQSIHIAIVVCLGLTSRFTSAADENLRTTVTRVDSFDGTPIFCESRGTGDTTLLFLHGWCGTHHYWKHQADRFAKDFRVIAIDQAGHGESGKQRQEWTIESLASDVAAVVETLKLDRVILIGHSMGGPVSLAAAPKLNGKLIAIIGVDTLHNAEFVWNADESNGFLTGLKNDFQGTLRAGLKGLNRDDVDPDLLKALTEDAVIQYPTMALGLMTDMTRLDEKKLLSNAKVPVRCINAAPTFAFAIKTEVDTNRKYADYEAVIMEDVGHYPMLERPDEFSTRLAEVLEKLARK